MRVEFPSSEKTLDQNEEFFVLTENGESGEKIRFHEYEKIYKVKGLYEKIFHEKLKCNSPSIIANMLHDSIENGSNGVDSLRVLDFGAGNGHVANELQQQDPDLVVGVDILKEAKEAAERDNSEVYDSYFVTDMANPETEVFNKLKSYQFNTMVSVAALGYDHIPPDSFINAFNLVEDGGYVAFNLRDKFLLNADDSGFKNTLDWISDDYVEILKQKTYVHRYSTSGEEIKYTAIVGKKIKDIEAD